MAIYTDIAIVGAGPAGMIAAAGFAHAGRKVTLIDRATPVTDDLDPQADHRSTAFLRPAIDLFQEIGIWPTLRAHAQVMRGLRIVDLSGEPPTYRDERLFLMDGEKDEPLGWNCPNWLIRQVFLDYLRAKPNVSIHFGCAITDLFARTKEARLSLSDGTRIRAKLIVGADGRASRLRELAQIGVRTTQHGQTALAFVARHDRGHDDISTELYHHGGPFTMVPLADLDGTHRSAIVWMNEAATAHALCEMDGPRFDAAMYARTAGLFGRIEKRTPIGSFDVVSQVAHELSGERLALIAEAAHVMPPIGAQGLNTSINDIVALLGAVQTSDDPGLAAVLETYESSRKIDISRRTKVIDLFNRVTRSRAPVLQAARLWGLKAAHDIAPLRENLIRLGMKAT